jgi:hypothetical protein
MVGYFCDLAANVEADCWTVMVGYFHDLGTEVDLTTGQRLLVTMIWLQKWKLTTGRRL